jgi:hypothetical protein
MGRITYKAKTPSVGQIILRRSPRAWVKLLLSVGRITFKANPPSMGRITFKVKPLSMGRIIFKASMGQIIFKAKPPSVGFKQ